MIDSIYIAETGLKGFEKGLQNISSNTTNLDTPGFKASTTQFADMFYNNDNPSNSGSSDLGQAGYGLNTLGTTINFAQGQFQSTGNSLDLAINGQGFFVLEDANGKISYTQDGQFKFDNNDKLISSTTGEAVMARDGSGNLTPITLTDLKTGAAQATSTVVFTGNLSSSATSDSVANVTVIDGAGSSHALTVNFAPVTGVAGSWTATVMDGTKTVGSGKIDFSSGQPVAGSNTVSLNYTPSGGAAMPLKLDFSSNVTSFDSGTSSSLAVASQDGHASGTLSNETFDSTGTLILTYSNGQTVKNKQLALAQFSSVDNAQQQGNNEFTSTNGQAWLTGVAGTGGFGAIQSGEVEMSNVDLSQQFSDLVIMQRGYQASSQIVSTANDMLTTLFGMWSK